MELIDIVDENNELTRKAEDRQIVHEKGLWHRHVGIWIMNEKGEVLLQKRSPNILQDPNEWGFTAGHITSKEEPEEAIIREAEEEIGIEILQKEILDLLSIQKLSYEYQTKKYTDHVYIYHYFIMTNKNEDTFELQKEEVSKVRYFTIEEIEEAIINRNDAFTFTMDDSFLEVVERLKEKRKMLFNNQNELLDIVDENNKETGVIGFRDDIHKKGLWHRHVGLWIMNKQGELLFQKRAKYKKRNPNKWARTGGHVDAGEDAYQAMIREAKEEIGIELHKEDLELLQMDKFDKYQEIDQGNMRHFVYNFFIVLDIAVSEFVLQKEEVSQVKYISIEEMEHFRKNKAQEYTFIDWDAKKFDRVIKKIKLRRERI